MAQNWWFHYQQAGGEDEWVLERADARQQIIRERQPAFVTVLDLTGIPDDHDWSKIRYRGPLYFDFDADGDLERVCEQFKLFLAKLHGDVQFDLHQARLFCSGGKGFHVEIPEQCIHVKVPEKGTVWLPYVYRSMAEALVVDTMDTLVYTGKRGRMWRTPGVQRDNGNYKVQITLEEAMDVTPTSYLKLVSEPRQELATAPPVCNNHLAMLFDRARGKVLEAMRGKKKRLEKANAVLDPWRKIGKHPPTIERIMAGVDVSPTARFQSLSMQLAIYAASVGMEMEDFLKRSEGLCRNHVSDSSRYNSFEKRQQELARMYRYMCDDSLYEFDPGPIARLVKPGVSVADLGIVDSEDHDDKKPETTATATADGDDEVSEIAEGQQPEGPVLDMHRGMRRGVVMNADGIFKRDGEDTTPLCRATMRKVDAFFSVETHEFRGYEFDLCVKGRVISRPTLSSETFTSAAAMKKFFAAFQIGYQGGEPETTAILDIMAEKAARNGRTYTYPREGLFVLQHPEVEKVMPVIVYLTQDSYETSLAENDPKPFRLRYRPEQAVSTYKIDIHKAPDLGPQHEPAIHDLLTLSRPETLADLLGMFVAFHYRSFYLRLFNQFPLLQVFGEAGSGKTQTVLLLAHMHWYLNDIPIMSASSGTNFAVDNMASTSTSAPMLIDEYKPHEMRAHKGRLEKVKDVFKACYVGSEIGGRGTINRGSETNLAVIRTRCTAPIVYLAEAIEMETAIFERSVTVPFSKAFHNKRRTAAYDRLQANPEALSALGKRLVEMAFSVDLEKMRQEVNEIKRQIMEALPDEDNPDYKRPAPRLIFNRAVVIHGLRTLQRALQSRFGDIFDGPMAEIMDTRIQGITAADMATLTDLAMSEIAKVFDKMSTMSWEEQADWALRPGQEYTLDSAVLHLNVNAAYERYRRYCQLHGETPLFTSNGAFTQACRNFSPVTNLDDPGSPIRKEGMTDRIINVDVAALRREGVNAFRLP